MDEESWKNAKDTHRMIRTGQRWQSDSINFSEPKLLSQNTLDPCTSIGKWKREKANRDSRPGYGNNSHPRRRSEHLAQRLLTKGDRIWGRGTDVGTTGAHFFPATCKIALCPSCQHLDCKVSGMGDNMTMNFQNPSGPLVRIKPQAVSNYTDNSCQSGVAYSPACAAPVTEVTTNMNATISQNRRDVCQPVIQSHRPLQATDTPLNGPLPSSIHVKESSYPNSGFQNGASNQDLQSGFQNQPKQVPASQFTKHVTDFNTYISPERARKTIESPSMFHGDVPGFGGPQLLGISKKSDVANLKRIHMCEPCSRSNSKDTLFSSNVINTNSPASNKKRMCTHRKILNNDTPQTCTTSQTHRWWPDTSSVVSNIYSMMRCTIFFLCGFIVITLFQSLNPFFLIAVTLAIARMIYSLVTKHCPTDNC